MLVKTLAACFPSCVTRLNKLTYDTRHVSEMIGEQRVITLLREKVRQQEEEDLQNVSP